MEPIVFNGQQTDEKILYKLTPHPLAKNLALAKIMVIGIFFFLIIQLIGGLTGEIGIYIRIVGSILSVLFLVMGIWWTITTYTKARTYITDRRVIRFEITTPFVEAKRALFWSEALKAKVYPPNLLYKLLKLGTVRVEPQAQDGEDVIVTDVYLYEDVGNYIDKILYTCKNKPEEVNNIRPFIAKPRGQRDI